MMRHVAPLTAAVALLVSPATAQTPDSVAPPPMRTDVPLFDAHEPLTLTIEAPLESIMKERGQESEEFPGIVAIAKPNGGADTLSAEIRTRGKARLRKRICRFPPLRLDFPQDSVAGTVFAGQDKLKLVTHCQDDREEYEQYVLLEYLIYRTYNLLTDLSFRVRLARITYRNTEKDDEPVTRYAFLIEDEDMLAARHGWTYYKVPGVPPNMVDPENLALVGVFQYFIGNADFSAFMPEPDKDECCHNIKPIGEPTGPLYCVPYDFDLAGLLNTRYANRLFRENLRTLGIRSVRQRLYRGLCYSQPYLPQVFDLFNRKREAIYALYRDLAGLDGEVLEDTLEYLDEFYETINDERKAKRAFQDRCRKV